MTNAAVGNLLTMLCREPDISGLLLFLRGYSGFAARGHRLGWASFSVRHTPVHNMYVAFGAPAGCWFWVRQLSDIVPG